MNFKVLVLFLLGWTFVSSLSFAEKSKTEKAQSNFVRQCYKDHPFFLNAVALLTDEEITDAKKSAQRKKDILKAFADHPTEVRQCLDEIISYAQTQNEPEEMPAFLKRLSEISTVVYQGKQGSANKTDR